jgi:hypothetical protein
MPAEFTVVVAVLLLLDEFASLLALVTVAVLLSGPAAVGVTTIVTVAVLLFAIDANVQVTVEVPVQFPPALGVADLNVTPAGSGSLTLTPAAASGPLLWIVSV